MKTCANFFSTTLLIGALALLSSCKVNESVVVRNHLYADKAETLRSVEGHAAKFGMGNLTRRHQTKISAAARLNLLQDQPLAPEERFSNMRTEVVSKHFFIFRQSRALVTADVIRLPQD